MSKQFWGVIAAIIVVFIGIYAIAGHKSGTPSGNTSQVSNHLEGGNSAGVTLVEYGDYQCPACGEYYQPLKDTVKKFNSQIHFQFRNFPLTSLHPNAFAGARAAEAAAIQGKFWQMHDLLYDQNVAYYNSGQTTQTWINASDPLNDFVSYAKQLGLDTTQFKQDYASDKVNSIIDADMAEGNKLNITATPTFFLDGKQIQPNPTVDSISQAISAEINAKTKK